MLDFQASALADEGRSRRPGRQFPPTSPGTGCSRPPTAISTSPLGDNLWKRFCGESPATRNSPATPISRPVPLRAKNRPALIAHLNDVVRRKPQRYWVEA